MIWTTRPRYKGPQGLQYWSQGAGPALVLIHGVGLRAEAWAGMMPALTAHYTVYAVDMPGHGASSLQGVEQLSDYTGRIANLVQSLSEPVVVAGHSMGGLVALDLAISHPDMVRSVAAMNAVFERSADAARAVQQRAASLRETGRSDPESTLERWFGHAPSGARVDAFKACCEWLTSVNPDGYARAYSIFAHQDGPARHALSGMKMRALFITGENDPNSTPEMSRSMANLAPNGRSCIIEDAAHMAPMTHPDRVAAALIAHAQEAQT